MDYLITDIMKYLQDAVSATCEYRMLSIFICFVTILILVLPGRSFIDRLLIAALFVFLYSAFSANVLIRETYDSNHAMIIPFWSYQRLLSGDTYFLYEIGENILLFVPAGFLLGLLGRRSGNPRKLLWISMIFLIDFSATIEIIQLVGQVGLFEWDDIFDNGLGGLLGYLIVTFPLRARYTVLGDYNDR